VIIFSCKRKDTEVSIILIIYSILGNKSYIVLELIKRNLLHLFLLKNSLVYVSYSGFCAFGQEKIEKSVFAKKSQKQA
jgi:hypothetical protein